MKALYVHFPFCETKCHYCDFYSLGKERTKVGDASHFEEALRAECESTKHFLDLEMDTIFFGGGTPSMTPPLSMERAIRPLDLTTRLTANTEWTMEANPSSIDLENFKAYRALGINRVSMGVQSMKDELLTKLGRVHSRERALEALDIVFKAGFTNVSTDLLCGVPGQSTEDLKEALHQLTQFPITHLSCYLLTLTKHHRMYKELPSEETQLEHLLLIDDWMKTQGFEHYEISNFAKPGKQARHNLNYWQGESYLGLGPSAHSFRSDSNERWKNVSSLHKYAELLKKAESPIEWTEKLTSEQRSLEKWMLTLRLAEGFPETWLSDLPRQIKAKRLIDQGLLESHPVKIGFTRLTARGFALSDQVIAELA